MPNVDAKLSYLDRMFIIQFPSRPLLLEGTRSLLINSSILHIHQENKKKTIKESIRIRQIAMSEHDKFILTSSPLALWDKTKIFCRIFLYKNLWGFVSESKNVAANKNLRSIPRNFSTKRWDKIQKGMQTTPSTFENRSHVLLYYMDTLDNPDICLGLLWPLPTPF